MNNNLTNTISNKTLKEYFLEYKTMMNCDRLWLICSDNTNINIKTDYKFFAHLIGI